MPKRLYYPLMWGRIPPKVWLVVYPIAVIALLLSMKAVHAPAEAWIKQRTERGFGPKLELTWQLEFPGEVTGLELAPDGIAVLHHYKLYELTFELYELDGKLKRQVNLENPGGHEAWLAKLDDGYIINSPGVAAKVSLDGELMWSVGRDDIPADPGLPAEPQDAAGMLLTEYGIFGVDNQGKLAWRTPFFVPQNGRTLQWWGSAQHKRAPAGEFVIYGKAGNWEPYDVLVINPTGGWQCTMWFQGIAMPEIVPLSSGGIVACPSFDYYQQVDSLKVFWGGPEGQARLEETEGCWLATAPDPQGDIHLIREEVEKRDPQTNLIPSLITEFDAAGNQLRQFEMPCEVLGLAYGDNGLLYLLWQVEPHVSPCVVMLSCTDRQGTEQWHGKVAEFEKALELSVTGMRVTPDRLYLAWKRRYGHGSNAFYCLQLPDD